MVLCNNLGRCSVIDFGKFVILELESGTRESSFVIREFESGAPKSSFLATPLHQVF